MEKPSEDTRFCSNCRRDIAASNYLMHTMHCQRNLTLCKQCDEPIPRNEIDQHMQELHSQVPCGKCSAIVECCKLEDHMHSACSKRTVKCSFCDLECVLDEMKTHESYCGSRTEICNFCKQYVMIKEKEEHDLGNCAKAVAKKQYENNRTDALNNQRIKQRNNGSSYRMPEGAVDNRDLQPEIWSYQPNTRLEANTSVDILSDINQSTLDEQLALDLAREDLENLQASQYGELWGHTFDDETALPFPRTLIPTMLGERAVISDYNNDEFIIPVVNSVQDGNSGIESTHVESDEVELPCEFCGELYPSEVLIQHQSGCNPEMAHGTTVKSFSNNSSITSNTQLLEEEKNVHEDKDTIPCEFCSKCFPSDYLIQHESGCRSNVVHGPPPWSRKDKQQTSESSVVSSSYSENSTIPCEFCGDLFPHHLVVDHQAICDANPLETILSDELYPSSDKSTSERKQRTLKHQEDPQLEEITSLATSNTFVKDMSLLSNEKPVHIIEHTKSPTKELDTMSETSRHSYSQSKSLCDSKRKSVTTDFPNIDSYFERSERNYHNRIQKDKSLEDILKTFNRNRGPEYRSLHDTSSQGHTPYRERDSHFYSERLHHRDNWSSMPAGARPKSCSNTSSQDDVHPTASLSRSTCIDSHPKPKFNSRLSATLPPFSESLSRGIRDTRQLEYSTHTYLQSLNQGNGDEIAGKSKSMKRKGMELHRR